MWIKIVLLFFVFSFLFKTDSSFDQDLGRHLKLGEIITGYGLIAQQTYEVPKTNLFSYTNPDFPFINTHWLFEILIYVVNQTIGLHWMLVLKLVLMIVAVWLTFKIIPDQKSALLLPIGFIFLHVLRERAELRPEIFSFLFTAITYYILELSLRAKRSNLLFVLPLIQLIWINTHIYFFVGLVLQAIFFIHLGYKYLRFNLEGYRIKLLGLIFGLSVLVSFINPNGVSGLLYPLNVTQNYGYTIVENQTMFLLESIQFKDPNFLFVKISMGIILLSLVVVILNAVKNLKIKPRDPSLITQDDGVKVKDILLSSFGLILALINVRSFPYLVFISLPAVLMNFPSFKFKGFVKTLTILTVPLIILESYFYLGGDYYRYTDSSHQVGLKMIQSVKGGMDFVQANDLPGPIYNNFDIGSYILYRGYPKYRVFVDGRPEAYPAQFFTGVYIPSQSEYKNFKEVEKIYGFKTIIFSHTDQTPWGRNFLQNVVKDETWKLVYIDDFMIILVKKEMAVEKNLTVLSLDKLDPNQYDFKNHVSYLRLGIFLQNSGNQASATAFFKKAYSVFPQSPILTGKRGSFFW